MTTGKGEGGLLKLGKDILDIQEEVLKDEAHLQVVHRATKNFSCS